MDDGFPCLGCLGGGDDVEKLDGEKSPVGPGMCAAGCETGVDRW